MKSETVVCVHVEPGHPFTLLRCYRVLSGDEGYIWGRRGVESDYTPARDGPSGRFIFDRVAFNGDTAGPEGIETISLVYDEGPVIAVFKEVT
jgi:hypothetical protein